MNFDYLVARALTYIRATSGLMHNRLSPPMQKCSFVFQTFGLLLSPVPFRQFGNTTMKSLLVITDYKKPRKSAVRYRCQLPVTFNWHQEGQHMGAGFTRDVSLDGALIQSTVSPPVGCEVSVEILVPSPNEDGKHLRVQCTGKVNGVVRQSGGYSFGVRGFFDDRITLEHGL